MKWSEEAWSAAQPVYEKIIQHPFITGLMDGTLDKAKFEFYIQQDALYLAEYGKMLMGIAQRLSDPKHIEAFIYFAGDSMAVEKALHQTFLKNLDIKVEAAPGCMLYTSYLLRQLAVAPVEVILAAVLPCFWIYKEVGDFILKNQVKGENPYQDWIDTYGGEDFEKSVQTAITICDEVAEKCTAEQRKKMTEAYVMCSRLEWIFWDSAYKMEKWAV